MPGQRCKPVRTVVEIIIVLGVIWYFWGGGLEKQVAKEMHKIEQNIATDSVDQYRIAKTKGSAIDACAYAELVAAAYLQAMDAEQYITWKKIQRTDCELADMEYKVDVMKEVKGNLKGTR